MNIIKILPRIGVLLAALTAAGCAGTPPQSQSASGGDRTPSWMRHHVVGSRIPRHTDANGRPSSASYVVVTSGENYANLPSVARRTERGPSLRR